MLAQLGIVDPNCDPTVYDVRAGQHDQHDTPATAVTSRRFYPDVRTGPGNGAVSPLPGTRSVGIGMVQRGDASFLNRPYAPCMALRPRVPGSRDATMDPHGPMVKWL